MALRLGWTAGTGVLHSAAYARVTVVSLGYDPPGVSIMVKVFANQAMRAAAKDPVASLSYQLDGSQAGRVFSLSLLDHLNPVAVAYDWLKTHRDYAGAVDV